MHIAVDLGSGSGRVFLVAFDVDGLLLEEQHRFVYPPRILDGALRWDLEAIFNEIGLGLERASRRSRELGRPVDSLGIDSWAVDYAWLDENGAVTADPICYRDDRTDGVPERVFEQISGQQIFERTGIQIQRFNTLYQMYSDKLDGDELQRFLLIPDLIGYMLTGKIYCEFTNATTTQLVDRRSGNWDAELLGLAGVDSASAPEIVSPGTIIGPLMPDAPNHAELEGVVLIAPATHDTASAVAAAPLKVGTAYISSGTWSLVGIETTEPITSREAAEENFTNEGGVAGTFRFLKNVMGLWILESCRREWAAEGVDVGYDVLLGDIADDHLSDVLIYPDDDRFVNPSSMLKAIALQLSEGGHKMPDEPSMVCKMICDSLAFRYASVIRSIERIAGAHISSIEILGGGGRNNYLNQMTANVCGRLVCAGIVEATVIGNALVQAISIGRFSNIAAARNYVVDHHGRRVFDPRPMAGLTNRFDRYLELENYFCPTYPA